MRIGDLAALVGVSTRTVRHYHRLGLLPEPVRLANGYRDYRLRDAVAMARVRTLAELGLSLDQIRDVLADDRVRELREVLVESSWTPAWPASRRRSASGGHGWPRLLAVADLHPDSTVWPDMTAGCATSPPAARSSPRSTPSCWRWRTPWPARPAARGLVLARSAAAPRSPPSAS